MAQQTEGNADALYKKALAEASKKKPSLDRAFELLNRAVEAGSNDATYALATWYLHGQHVAPNLTKGTRLLKIAAKNLVPDALYDLAVSYETGKGVRRNEPRALELYTGAALRGDKQSIYEVGRCYYHGIGTPKNRRLSKIWLDRARELGVRG